MDDDVRQLFQRELPGFPEPPLGTLVRDSLRQGRRMRAVRRLYGATALVAVAIVIAAVAPLGSSPSTGAPPAADASSTADAPFVEDRAAASTPSGSTKATPEGLLEVLLQDLPDGRTSHYAKASDKGLHVQAFLDNDQSDPGMIRIRVIDGPDAVRPQMMTDRRSWTLPSGNRATVVGLPEDCTRALHVEVRRPSGLVVTVDVGSCLAWSGFLLGQGRLALTQDQAVAIADDPRLSVQMASKLIRSGTKRAGGLATFDEVRS